MKLSLRVAGAALIGASLGCLHGASAVVAAEPLLISDSGAVVAASTQEFGSSVSPSFDGDGRLRHGEFDDALANIQGGISSPAEMAELAKVRPAPGHEQETVIGVDNRVRVNRTRGVPARKSAWITFSVPGGTASCTGWFINKNTIATAGHCVHSGGSSGSYYTRSTYRIYPGRNGASSPYGSCTAKELWTNSAWAGASSGPDNDYGAIKLNCNIGSTVGWFGYFRTSRSLNNLPTEIWGYPGDKPSGTQWRHADKVHITQARRVFYKNDTAGGQSGSAVWYNRSTRCQHCAMAIHAYGTNNQTYNSGTRITETVFDFLNFIKRRP